MKWHASTLGEVINRDGGLIQTGPFGSQLHQADYQPEGLPVVMPKDIVDGGISTETIARISEHTARRLSRHIVKPGTIVLPRRGDIAKRALIRPEQSGWLCGTGCLKIETRTKEMVPEFLYYFMSQGHVVQWLLQNSVGTTMLNLSAEIISKLPIKYPRIQTQIKIASCLKTYDDLIENNRRRMAKLEEAARLLYQEWFVRLRFPGHEHTRIVNGVPEGWSRIPLEDTLVLQRGFDLPSQERRDGAIPIYASTGINGYHDKAMVKGPGVVTGRSGTLGVVHFVWGDFWPLNTALWVKEFRQVTPVYASFLLRQLDLKQYNGGVSVPTLDRKTVHRIEVLLPPPNLIDLFDNFASDSLKQQDTLALTNEKLRAARDLLLPRLMSGEIVV